MSLFVGVPRMAVGLGSPFSPTNISGLVLWLRADALGLSDGTAVSSWTDSSGTGNTVTQGTGSLQPIYHTNITNGLPGVQFDGVDDFLSSGTATALSPGSNTVLIVTQPTLSTASQKSYACLLHYRSQNFYVARLSTNFWGTFLAALVDLSSGNALTSGTNYLLEGTSAASGNTVLYQRGSQVAQQGSAELGPTGATQIGVGKDLVNANRQYAGYINEIVMYNTVLSSGDRVLVENYLIAKWGL